MATVRNTRTSEDPDVDYPVFDPGQWAHSGHLPTTSEVIGAIRYTVSNKVSGKDAAKYVAAILIDHWTNRNVYTKTTTNVQNQVVKMYIEFKLMRKIFKKGKPSQASLERYVKFKGEKNNVLDISTQDKDRIHTLEDYYGVKMSSAEHHYFRSQKDSTIARNDSRKILCFAKKTDVDPVWMSQEVRKAKLEKYQEKQQL